MYILREAVSVDCSRERAVTSEVPFLTVPALLLAKALQDAVMHP
jgi:hypothetical protein